MYNLALTVVVFLILGGSVYNLFKNKSEKLKNKEATRTKTAAIIHSSGASKSSSIHSNETGILLFHPSLYEANNYDSDDDDHQHDHSSHCHDQHHDSSSYSFDSSSYSGGGFSSCD